MPFDAKSQLTAESCTANMSRLAQALGCDGATPSARTRHAAGVIPTTHVFGLDRAESILLADNEPGLLSIHRRDPASLAAKQTAWREKIQTGLHFYVFTYLGIQQPHYAGPLTAVEPVEPNAAAYLPNIPIGVFVEKQAENKRASPREINATFRDLAVRREAFASIPPEDWFLHPGDSRLLCSLEVAASFGNDFWRYWGNPFSDSFWADASKAWKVFHEFHFLTGIAPDEFGAVVWPNRLNVRRERDNSSVPLHRYPDDVYSRSIERWPGLRMFLYDWTARDGEVNFLEGCFDLAHYYAIHGVFPEGLEDAEAQRWTAMEAH